MHKSIAIVTIAATAAGASFGTTHVVHSKRTTRTVTVTKMVTVTVPERVVEPSVITTTTTTQPRICWREPNDWEPDGIEQICGTPDQLVKSMNDMTDEIVSFKHNPDK